MPDAPAPLAAPPTALPRWARVVDAFTLGAALITLSVVVFGGFRITVGDVRISVMDWWRPAVLALVALGLRHLRVRHDPVWQRLRLGLSAFWRAPDVRAVLPIYLTSRLGVLVIGFLAVVLIGFPFDGAPPFQIYGHALLDLPARWDTGWYLGIATEGYHWSPAQDGRQQNIAFFPGYPLTTRVLAVVLGRQPLWAGVVVSLVAFFAALVYLLRLGRDLLGDEDQAVAAVTFLAAYPFAIFYSAAYTEALFLLAMVGAVYHFRRDERVAAAGWGALAGLTRPNGAFLSVVLGLMVLQIAWREWRDRREGAAFAWGRHLDRLATASAPGMGMLVYSTYILFLTGHPLQWTAQNAAWGRTYRPLDTVVTDRLDYISQNGLYGYLSSQTIDLFYLASVAFILAAVWPVFRRFGLPYAVLLLITVLPPMAAGGLLSMGRVTSVLFPAFLWLGAVVPPPHRTAWVAGLAGLQALAAVLFFTWRPLY